MKKIKPWDTNQYFADVFSRAITYGLPGPMKAMYRGINSGAYYMAAGGTNVWLEWLIRLLLGG
jgi:hypothetical protein